MLSAHRLRSHGMEWQYVDGFLEVEANPDILASAGVSGPYHSRYANASIELASDTCKLSEYGDLKSL